MRRLLGTALGLAGLAALWAVDAATPLLGRLLPEGRAHLEAMPTTEDLLEGWHFPPPEEVEGP